MKEAVELAFISGQEKNYQLTNALTVIFCLTGKIAVETTVDIFNIQAEGVAVVNPLTPYRIQCSGDSYAICLHIDAESMERGGWNDSDTVFCHIAGRSNQTEPANTMRMHISKLIQDYFYNDENHFSKAVLHDATELIHYLLHTYVGKSNMFVAKNETKLLLARALHTMQENYADPELTIQSVAETEFISVSYLSRLFQTILHSTFTSYLTAVRLEHAMAQLRDGRNSITYIAEENGFKNVNSFISYFHRQYGATPGQYRKKKLNADSATANRIDLQPLLQYYTPSPSEEHTESIRATVNITAEGQAIQHVWQGILNIGYAREGLTAAVQNQIRQAQKEIGFEFARIHGVFDDEMHIYQENMDGSPWYNFLYADILLDFMLDVGLKPYIEMGYMPNKLAKDSCRIFDRNSLFSVYNDGSKWITLVQASIAHWIERYGLQAVSQWRFSMIGLHCIYTDEIPINTEEYYAWYKNTYDAIKGIDSALQFGGPSVMSNLENWPARIIAFLEYTKEKDCIPNFFCAQCHPHDSKMDDKNFIMLTKSQDTAPSTLSGDIDYTAHFIAQCRAVLDHCGFPDMPILLDEWNSTLWQRDLSGDTCYKSAWMIKNSLENTASGAMLGYYLLTDFIEEWMTKNNTVFHGGYGLFTINGIPKAGYQAMRLLHKAGKEKIASGRGWFVTRDQSEQSIQIFLYHYCHYSGLYRHQYQRIRNPEDAYRVFEERGDLHIHLSLTGVRQGSFREEQYTINRAHGSAFDKWMQMGAPEILRRSDMEYLSAGAQPLCTIRDFVNMVPQIEIDASLRPHEVKLIILQYQQY